MCKYEKYSSFKKKTDKGYHCRMRKFLQHLQTVLNRTSSRCMFIESYGCVCLRYSGQMCVMQMMKRRPLRTMFVVIRRERFKHSMFWNHWSDVMGCVWGDSGGSMLAPRYIPTMISSSVPSYPYLRRVVVSSCIVRKPSLSWSDSWKNAIRRLKILSLLKKGPEEE